MISFECDYAEGAHPELLKRFAETNLEQLGTYGTDIYSARAKEKIRAACDCPEAEVFFLTGGTQTNQITIASLLASYEGVVAVRTGHVGNHEAGAIEYTGHKVLELPEHEGKMCAKELEAYLATFFADGNREHMVFPGMVYISHPTELGTLYSKEELTALSEVCRRYELPLYLDGARLGYGLMSYRTDVTMADVARLCDVFYIGGTKIGALCGEALVFSGRPAPKHFMTIVKQHGALLAKGRLVGIQFDALFTEDLYFRISRHAIDMAEKLKVLLQRKGYRMFVDSPTNQQFVVLDNEKLRQLLPEVEVSIWEPVDEEHTLVRFATSWATTEEMLEQLEKFL